jgi:tetratricopeptide (TPR) repeat protein
MNMHDKAIVHFEKALSEQPSGILMLSAAMSYKELGNSAKAQELLTKVMESDIDAILVQKSRYMLADFAMQQGDLNKAGKLYQAIVDADPQAADAWFQLGLIYEKQNDPIKARAAWRKVIAINPNYADARKKLAEKL